jgi:small subunit ribosomal protein S16
VSVKIRLKRYGTKKRPFYRLVVVDSRKPRDGRTIEEVGLYHPIEVEGKQLKIKEERVKEWIQKGARPTDTVRRLLNKNERSSQQEELSPGEDA